MTSGRQNLSRSAHKLMVRTVSPLRVCTALLLLLCTGLMVSCSSGPSAAVIDDTIRRHFEARQYRVVELTIGQVASIPLREKTYMGTPGYTVEVQSITLEALSSTIPGTKKGGRYTFSKAAVVIRESPDRQGGWTISRISGIPLV